MPNLGDNEVPSVVFDPHLGTITVNHIDGSRKTHKVSAEQLVGVVDQVTLFPKTLQIEIVVDGECISIPIKPYAHPSSARTVYLDQNHWIYFARYWRKVGTLDEGKASFFEALESAIESGQVITPISGGHLVETSKRRPGFSRVDLAATMLHFSRGWQMMSPLSLRRAEARQLFGGPPLNRNEILLFQERGMLAQHASKADDSSNSSPLDPILNRLTWATTLVTLLISSSTSAESGHASARWASSFPPLSDELHRNTKARARAREATLIRFLADAQDDFAGAALEFGMSAEQFGRWLKDDADASIAKVLGISRLREVMHERLMNPQDKWEANDLNDWIYLSYASAYLDLVVGEKKTSGFLNRISRRVPKGSLVTHSSSSATAMLSELLQRTR